MSELSSNDKDKGNDIDHSDDDMNSDEENIDFRTLNSDIHGYYGKVMDRSRIIYENKIQTNHQQNIVDNDLVVEDLNQLFVNEEEFETTQRPMKSIKQKKRRKQPKTQTSSHHKVKLNHWDIMAMDQLEKETCGCRHQVKRVENKQIISQWCPRKDYQHKELKKEHKIISHSEQITSSSPPKRRRIKTKPEETNQLALAYDPSSIDYHVIEQRLYYRTSSGRLVNFL